jgi:hypothetical protein
LPTHIEEQNRIYLRSNETKIIGFLRYRNNENYFEARNNLFSPLSAKFSEEKMKKFHDNITNIFLILNMKLIGKIWVSNNFAVSKHLVTIKYSYNSKEYIDEVLFSVRSNISDTKETHIELIECHPQTNTPLCVFLKNL